MDGITYIEDSKTNKKYAHIDLEKYGDLWDDILDLIIAQSRKYDKKIPLSDVKKLLAAEWHMI